MIEFKDKQKTVFNRVSNLKDKATTCELLFKERLDKNGIKYLFQKGFIADNGYYIVDFYLPKPFKVCIEIDGGYHNTQFQKEYDKRKDEYLMKRGFRVIRIKNEDVLNFDIDKHI